MNRALAALLSVLSCFSILAASAAAATPSVGSDLYLAQAASGELTGSKLVLRGLAPRVTTFTDRPQRSASSVAAGRFVAGWKRTFGDDPPNAALEVEGAPKGRDVAVVELRNPRYDRREGTVVFSVRRLKESGDPALRSYDARADGSAVREFGRASLFIDGGEPPTELVLVRVSVGAGQTVDVDFSVPLTPLETFFSGIRTPPTNQFQTSNGLITAKGGEFSLQASPGGGGLEVEFIVEAGVEPGDPVAGRAVVPAGSTVSMALENGEPQSIASGPFSIGG